MKNPLAFVLLAVVSCCLLVPAAARAQFADYGCSVKLESADGKVKRTYLERQSAQRFGPNLNLYFSGGVYDGFHPVTAAFKIEDRFDTSQSEILTREITPNWHWQFSRQTKAGRLTVVCE